VSLCREKVQENKFETAATLNGIRSESLDSKSGIN